jgi:thiamine pyrophosphokinase
MPAEEFISSLNHPPRRRVFLLEKTRAVLFANGELKESAWLAASLTASDALIAIDGGLNHLESLGLTPDLLIGDLDSVSTAQIERVQAAGIEIKRFPPAKDETDLELALLEAHRRGFRSILLVAALGGRLDQTLGNLSLLLLPALADCTVRCEDGQNEVFIIRDSTVISGQPGEIVSLLPLWGEVKGVTTTNLAYPLNHETLYPERSRGISNRMIAQEAVVSVDSGNLLCIHTHISEMENK